MFSARLHWSDSAGWTTKDSHFQKADLFLFLREREALAGGRADRELNQRFPDALIVGSDLCDNGVGAQAISFTKASTRLAREHEHETGCAQLHNQTMTVFLMRETVN